jgi:eukaryotic-like serine/threonine-protein kinase
MDMCARPALGFAAEELARLLSTTPYVVRSLLGRGGAGTVYEVEHSFLGRRFALKVLHPHVAATPGLPDRLRVEAQALGRLRHPNIVDVVDFWIAADGTPCVVMELLRGRTLHAELRERERLPATEVLELATQALRGLTTAHALGIVHRDIKPENLFLHTEPGLSPRLKILDFGWARVLPDFSERSPLPAALPTQTGATVGSPLFMSPEGARGEKVDFRADIYSLGLVVYAALGGFIPDTYSSTIPLPSQFAEGDWYPPGLDDIILRAIEWQPEARFQTAQEFLGALQPFARGSVPPRAPSQPDGVLGFPHTRKPQGAS